MFEVGVMHEVQLVDWVDLRVEGVGYQGPNVPGPKAGVPTACRVLR